jgi:hypothetical protein
LIQHIYLDEQAPVAALAFHPLEHALAVVPTDPNSKVSKQSLQEGNKGRPFYNILQEVAL